ncbi:uncharacterized protein LOC117299811 [Asterias rubens]|uniref:uncharacterized protein LOC117299811 n=1 Tax=Asterias rubens TaxID=7604 RepID=UPI00145536CB|nr:uncharacterized protein LOC117299811 [Asterias rubens]
MKGLAAKIAPVLIWWIWVTFLTDFVTGSPWHLGCVHDNASSLMSESVAQDLAGNTIFTPASCSSSCHDRGYLYAGVQSADNCTCSNSKEEFGEEAIDQQCNILCGNWSLPCGGDAAVSVYSVDGPYLLTAELSKSQHLVQEGSTVRFEARVNLAAETVADLGLDGFNTSHFEEIDFIWSVDGEERGRTSRLYGNSSAVESFVHTFSLEGKWQIDVDVSNPISRLHRTTSISVVQPLPADLQIILRPVQGDGPSCVPIEEASAIFLPAVSVFVGEEVEFQASVAFGINLTFVWMFDEGGVVNVTERYVEEPECEGIACMQDSEVHNFTTEGLFNVYVNVSNYLGSVQKTLHVVVVKREVTNLTMSLATSSAFINKVNSSVGLLINMVATARQQVLLQVDFGDGSVYNHSMYDVNDTFITVGDEGNAHLHLIASYGEGCTLFVSLSHKYRESGVFIVETEVFQKWTSESVGSARLDSAVVVQEELGPVEIETLQVYATNTIANLSLQAPIVTANMSYVWTLSSTDMTLNPNCQEMCLHNFTEPGEYVVEVTASNLVSTSHVQTNVAVHEAVSGLVLDGGSGGILATGTTVQFTASMGTGSDVQFTWSFSDLLGTTEQVDSLVNGVPISHVNHTYLTSGMNYNVSVAASNLISSQTAYLSKAILIQDPIVGLSLFSNSPTLLGSPSLINVTLLQGTQVMFTVDTPRGPVTPQVQYIEENQIYILEFILSSPGVLLATVVASNNVSSESESVGLVIQESIDAVSIQEFYPGNGQMVLLARLNGEIANGIDVMYTWFTRGTNTTSASPVLVLPACLMPEIVSVQASNQVDASYVEILAESAPPQSLYSLDYAVFGEAGKPSSWTFQISEDGNTPVQVLVNQGGSTPNTSYTATPGSPLTWNHTYPHPGVYPVHLWVSGAGEEVTMQTIAVMETKVSGVELAGPAISKFYGTVTSQSWEVKPSSGTNILYTLTVTPIVSDYSIALSGSMETTLVQVAGSHTNISIQFHGPGSYNITLQASNFISSVRLHSETILQQPIIGVSVVVKAALITTPSVFELIIKGGPPFAFKIECGDGEILTVSSKDVGNEVINFVFDPPVCVYTLNKTYSSLGHYDSSFTINNLVSRKTSVATARVEEMISGLSITSESLPLLAIGRSVMLTATVESGNDVEFSWDFQDSDHRTTLMNCLNESRATHMFSLPGTYQVSVSVSNDLQPQPLMVTYPQLFHVQELAFGLELHTPTGLSRGAALNILGDHRATDPLVFEASCWGSDILFYFEYGDGTVEKVVGVLDSFGAYKGSGNHQYLQEGNYTVGVTAGNLLGNKTYYLPGPYYVQVPPTNLRSGSSMNAYVFGNVSHLSVRVDAGSHLFYNWSMGDQTDYIDVGPSVDHIYHSPGTFPVTVVAFNRVKTKKTDWMVSIEIQVQGVELLVEELLHQTYSHITFEAKTITDGAQWYQWDMGDQRDPKTTIVNTLSYLYTLHGRYYVTVVAGNSVSNATSLPVELTVQTAINSVTINAGSATLVNRSTLFEAWVSGSNMNFVWDFGDGSETVYTSSLSVHHKYNRTGEFFLHLQASNLVSNSSASSKIFVLTRMCHPPVLDIVGADPRTEIHSEDIRAEAEVQIDCEVTNLALYTWTLKHSENGSLVLLDPNRASLDQRTLFIPRLYLPYGSYVFSLDVSMNGTIVYSQDSISIEVTKSPLVGIINGGTRRFFGMDMIATLNGSYSYDPDNPNDDDLSYAWTCNPINIPTAPCFNTTKLSLANQTSFLSSSNASIAFNTSWLLVNGSDSFVFTLRVSKEGRDDAEVNQVLTLAVEQVAGTNLPLLIDCHKCQDGFVNSNDHLTLEAVCTDCSENVTYTWELYVVLDGTTFDNTVDLISDQRCESGDGSYGQYLVSNDSSGSTPSSSPEEETNIISQSTVTSGTSTPQNSVSNVISTGILTPGGTGEDAGDGSTQPNTTSASNETIPFEGSYDGGDPGEGAGSIKEGSFLENVDGFVEETGGSLTGDVLSGTPDAAQGSFVEDTAASSPEAASFVEATNASFVQVLGNTSAEVTVTMVAGVSFEEAGDSTVETGNSFEEAGGGGSIVETGGSFEEAVGSFEEAAGSFEEAAGSFEEATGSIAETTGSLDEATGSLEEDAGSFAEATGSIAETTGSLDEATGSLDEATGSLGEAIGSLDEAAESLDEATGSLGEAIGSLDEATDSLDEATDILDTGSFEEAAGSFDEATGSIAETTGSLDEATDSLDEATGSFDEATGSLDEATGSLDEATGSLDEATGSLDEATGSFDEATGSFDEATGSFDEATGSGDAANTSQGTSLDETGQATGSFDEAGSSFGEAVGSLDEDTPGSATSNGTQGPGASLIEDTGSSLTEVSNNSPSNQDTTVDNNYEEDLDTNVDEPIQDTNQPSQNGSQGVGVGGGTFTGEFEGSYEDYPEEYLGHSEETDQNPPPPMGDTDPSESITDPGDEVRVDEEFIIINDHIVSKSLQQRVLSSGDTTTGLNGRALTLREGVLQESRTYAIVVQAHSHENGITRIGEAHQYTLVNTGPRAGLCSITPGDGTEMETVFTIQCLGWQDQHAPIQYEISYSLNETEDLTILYFGMKHAVKFQLPAGYENNSHRVYVKVAIVDGQGGKTSVCSINIQVLPKTFSPGKSVEEFLYNVTVAPSNLLSVYTEQGDQHNLNGFINMAACILNRQVPLTAARSDYTRLLSLRRHIRYALVAAGKALPMRDQFEIQQSSQATAASSYVPLELKASTVILAAELIETCSKNTIANVHLSGNLDIDILVALTSTMSSVVSALGLDHTLDIGMHNRVTAVNRTLNGVLDLLQTYLQTQKPGEEPLLIQTSSVDVIGSRQTTLANIDLTAGQNAFKLPAGIEQELIQQNGVDKIGAYMCHDMGITCWDVDMITYQVNPFTWGAGAEKVTTGVSSLNLHSCTGHDLIVENLPAGKEVKFEVEHTSKSRGEVMAFDMTFDRSDMNIHEFNVSEENMGQTFQIMVQMRPEVKRAFPVKLIMRFGVRPTPTLYDTSWSSEEMTEDQIIFLPPSSFNESGIYYLALIDADYGDSTYRQDEVNQRNYLIRLWWGECLYWNTEIDSWVNDGCRVMESSNYDQTQCRCNHLTSFGVSFLPVSIFLDIVSLQVFEMPNANPITYSFTASFLGIYIILFIYCHLADKHDEKKQGLIYLWDNNPADQQYYEITMETGMRAGAGTTARVSVVLHGEEGHSETKELICKGKHIFEKNSRDRFIISVPESLGNMQKVHVWHNNAGVSPSWFLSRVAVRDLINGQKWYFICERWFAVEEDDGKIERELEVMDKGVGFQKAFFAKLFQYFSDYYLWSSVFTRPPYSVFTRVQRLTCCMCISMGFMCINTIWYQHLDKEEVELGLIDVSGEAMLVGIVTALLAIPINFPVIMVFRRTRARREEIEEEKTFRSVKATVDIPESAEPVETILNEGSWDSGMGEHSDTNLHDLQGWAQEKWKNRQRSSINQSKSSSRAASEVSRSYDSLSFTSTSDASLSSRGKHADVSDSGVSSPDTHSMQSNYLAGCYQADHKRLTSPKIWLPNWCGMLAWGICVFISVFSAWISIYYGYRFSNVKSVYWMQSVYFSFLQCIFVTQPAVMLMFTIATSVRHKNNIRIFDHYDDNIDLIDKKSLERARLEMYDNDLAKAVAARQRSRYLRFARPPQEKELQKAKEKMLKEKNMWAILKDVIMCTTLFACLMWMAYGRQVAYHYPANQGIRQTFLQTPHPFTNISTVDNLWQWLNEDFLDTLYWETWYNGEHVTEEKKSIMSGDTILLGKASLRQVRIRHQSCPLAVQAQYIFNDCKSSYHVDVQSTQPYGPDGSWVHSSRETLKRYQKWGKFGSYEGDGYNVDLNNSRQEAASQLRFLENHSWIDDQTRAIFVEFTLYNAPTNLYTSVALLAEMPGTGAVHPLPKIESVLLHHYETSYDYFIMCGELLFLLLVAVSGMRAVQKLVKIKAQFFQSAWSWIEIGMILLSLTYFALYVCRFVFVNNATQHLRGTYMEEFVDMSFLAYWDQILKDLLGSIIFLACIKFLHLLRFNQTVAMFGAVIDGAVKEILVFALYLVILEVAFACLGVLLFCTHFYPLKHLHISPNILIGMIVGHPSDAQGLAMEFPTLWPMFYSVYIICMVVLMAGLIKAILCHSYKKTKQEGIQAVGGKEVIFFFWNMFLIRVGLRRLPEEDKPTTLPTEFTMAEIEYQVDELLFRMNAISNQHGLPEKPYGYFEDSDCTHGMMEDGMSSTCSEMNLFDSARLEDRVQKIETQLYNHNPELRELLDGNCFTDEDREKQLRAHLELEIFRQLQLQRQDEFRQHHELHDSGHDTQSTSEHMELGSDNISLDPPQALPNIRDAQGRLSFPKPMMNLGTLDMQAAPSIHLQQSSFINRKQAWGQQMAAGGPLVQRPVATLGLATVPTDRPYSSRRPNTTGKPDKRRQPDHRVKPLSASFIRRDPQLLSSSEVLDTQSSTSSSNYVHRTDSLSSHASDLVISQVNAALAGSNRCWDSHREAPRNAPFRRESKQDLDHLVRDYPDGEQPVERAISIESFPLPNALDSLSSSSGNEKTNPYKPQKGSKEADARHRLRKTRSRGKGKGRRRYDEAVYVNEAFSTDSEEEIPVIQMGPASMHHDRR